MIERADAIVVGAGCAGWFVTQELARRGISSVLLDKNPPAAFASTRNQGWLQSGAVHAAGANDPITARMCRDGYHWIRAHYPDVLHPDIPSYFLMESEEELDLCLTRCWQEAIPARPISVHVVREREPLLGQSRLMYAAATPDIPMDTTRLLQAVAEQAVHRGVRFRAVESLDMLNPRWDGDRWHLFPHPDYEVQSDTVILTCGVHIPEMIQCFVPGAVAPFTRTKVPVLVLHGAITRSLLITLYAPDGTCIVPFHGSAGRGATVCLSRTDVACIDSRDRAFPVALLKRYLARYAESFSDFYQGFAALVRERSINAHMYVCQKLHCNDDFARNPLSRRPTCLSYAPQPGGRQNLFAFYPGKFTASPIAARSCADEVERCTSSQWREIAWREEEVAPTIARQRYYDDPAYRMAIAGDRLVFRKIRPGSVHSAF